jgi:hypothetical protein
MHSGHYKFSQRKLSGLVRNRQDLWICFSDSGRHYYFTITIIPDLLITNRLITVYKRLKNGNQIFILYLDFGVGAERPGFNHSFSFLFCFSFLLCFANKKKCQVPPLRVVVFWPPVVDGAGIFNAQLKIVLIHQRRTQQSRIGDPGIILRRIENPAQRPKSESAVKDRWSWYFFAQDWKSSATAKGGHSGQGSVILLFFCAGLQILRGGQGSVILVFFCAGLKILRDSKSCAAIKDRWSWYYFAQDWKSCAASSVASSAASCTVAQH